MTPLTPTGELEAEMRAGLEGVTPGPWSHCAGGCQCTSINSGEHPVADVTKGDWGDDYPSLRFKEGGPGAVGETSVEAYMAQATYGHVDVETAMRNRAHIARCHPDNIRTLLDTIASLRLEVERLTIGLELSKPLYSRRQIESALDSVASYAWRTDPPNANNKLTDAERLSMIKWHPIVQKFAQPHIDLADKEPVHNASETS